MGGKTMSQFFVIQTDDDIPMGVAFSGTLEECERFVRLQWDLLTMSGNPVEIGFVIEEGPLDEALQIR